MIRSLISIPLVLAAVVAMASADRADAAPDLETWPIEKVLGLSAADLITGVPVRIEGVVTLATDSVTVQNGPWAIWVIWPEHRADSRIPGTTGDGGTRLLEPGMRVEVEGTAFPGGYAPTIRAAKIRIVSEGLLPEPVQADLGRLFSGGDNAVRIEIGGREEVIVQGCRENEANWILVLDVASRRCVLTIEKSLMEQRPDHLVDAKVRVIAIVGATRNSRGEFLAPNLRLARPDDITLLEPAPSSAFEAPTVSLAAIARYRPSPLPRRRIQTEGIVTCWVPGQYGYLQEGLTGVRVEAPIGPALVPGDRVRVAGFIDTSRNIAEITEGIVERIGPDRPPQPAAVTPAEISELVRWSAREGRIAEPSNYAGVLITFPATVVERQRVSHGWSFTLSSGDATTVARLQGGDAADDATATRLAIGTEVSVTGVARLDMAGPADLILTDNNADTGDVEILLRSAADLRVIRPPSWWTARRLAIAAGLLATVLVATAAWSLRLRQRGALLSQQLAAEQQSRHEADVEFQATLRERSRLAANLHDTVLQTVTGIGYQLATCKDDDGSVSGDVSEALDLVERMVGHAVQQLRGTVWALKATAPRDRPLPHAVAQLAVKLGHEYGRQVDIDVDEALPAVPDFVAGNLLLIAQEAILNALRHADGSLTEVSLRHDGSARAIVLKVRDDGRSFVPGNQGGTWEHHFGIEGMQERASQMGGTLTIDSRPHAGTTITVVVPAGVVASGQGMAAPPPYEGPVSSAG